MTLVASGSVSLANMRLSLDPAFADFSLANALAYPGHKLVIKDSANKTLTGYIKAAGTGETLGSELLTNGTFTDWTGDNPDGWTVYEKVDETSRVTEDPAGKCRIVTDGSAVYIQQNVGTSGALHKYSIDIDTLVTGKLDLRIILGVVYIAFESTGTKTGYYVGGSSPIFMVSRYPVLATDGTIDNTSLKQVLSPSATGATIVSTPNGSTYEWVEETGFNRNDASGYTYEIYRQRGGGLGLSLGLGL
jgi:hypothetical protein